MDLNASYAAAEQLYQSSQWMPAIAAYREIVAAHPQEVRAWALMGLCATQSGDLLLATAALQCAAELEPTAGNIHFRLGVVLYQRGLADDAEVAFRRTVALDPGNLDARQNLAAVLVDLGRPQEAQPIFEMIVENNPMAELAWAGLANVHAVRGNRMEMMQCLERALEINPDNTASRHLLAAAKGETPAHPDWRYVEDFFDSYAARFETHLVDRLEYAAPHVLTELIQTTLPNQTFARVLDLGCGTGLFGAAFRAAYGGDVLVGVDLSQRMVEAAVARGLYTQVHKAEAEAYVTQTPETFDLIAATDVFIYVGDVAGLIQHAYARLAPSGLLAFTIETTAQPDYALLTSGRYAHNRDDLLALAAQLNFKMIAEKRASLRKHAGAHEEGLYLVLQK